MGDGGEVLHWANTYLPMEAKLKAAVREVPDFPKPGILFKDITPLFLDPALSQEIIEHLHDHYASQNIEAVAGVESRGFLFGLPLALKLGVPFVLIRKKGKLPAETVEYSYDLEYGSAEIEMHKDALKPGQRVLVHDDLLATGGTANAAIHLCKQMGAEVAGASFLIELEGLDGRAKLEMPGANIHTLARC